MKTSWVLNEEEKIRFLASRRKKKKERKKESPIVGRKTFKETELLTEKEMEEIRELIEASEFFENSKVHDMDPLLIRELIR